MTAEGLLAELSTQGVQLVAQGSQLRIDAPKGVLTPELRQRLAERKDELLELIARADENPDGQQPAPSAHRQEEGVCIPPVSDATVQHSVEEEPIAESALAGYLVDVLAAHPVGRKAADREALAAYVARAILHRYGPPAEQTWRVGRPVGTKKLSTAPLFAVCPAGHQTDEALWHVGVVGWACEACQKVYDPRECRLIPRPHAEAR